MRLFVNHYRAMTASVLLLLAQIATAEEVRFNRDIRPFLSDTCFRCHGPDSTTRQAGLRLDIEADATAQRDGQTAIVAHKPEASETITRIFSDDPDVAMPPPKSGLKLTNQQKELFRRWVAEGAVYEKHWSFVPPRLPADGRDVGPDRGNAAFQGTRQRVGRG